MVMKYLAFLKKWAKQLFVTFALGGGRTPPLPPLNTALKTKSYVSKILHDWPTVSIKLIENVLHFIDVVESHEYIWLYAGQSTVTGNAAVKNNTWSGN
jgi:hypothetical protein